MGDKQLIIRRFSHSLKSYDKLAVVQQKIAARLSELIVRYVDSPNQGVEIGSGTGFLTTRLVDSYPQCDWTAIDIVASSAEYLPCNVRFIEGDGEKIDQIVSGIDILASASTVQWFDDLEGFIVRISGKLASGGVVAIATFGPDNFREITATTGHGLRYYSLDGLRELFDGFEILHSEQWVEQLNFADPIDVLHHLKATGVNAVEAGRWTKSRLASFRHSYIELFGEATLTFNPQIIIARYNG